MKSWLADKPRHSVQLFMHKKKLKKETFMNCSNSTSLRNVWIISAVKIFQTSNSYENIRIEQFRKYPSSTTPLPLPMQHSLPPSSLPLTITSCDGSPRTSITLSPVPSLLAHGYYTGIPQLPTIYCWRLSSSTVSVILPGEQRNATSGSNKGEEFLGHLWPTIRVSRSLKKVGGR